MNVTRTDNFAADVQWHQELLQIRCPPCPTFARSARRTNDPKGKGKDKGTDRGGITTAGAQAGGPDA